MKLKIFKPAIAVFIVLLAANSMVFAQVAPVPPVPPATPVVITAPVTISAPVIVDDVTVQPVVATVNAKALKVQLRQLRATLKNISVTANAQITTALKNLNVHADIQDVVPQISMGFKDLGDSFNNDGTQQNDNELVKNYSKTYPADGNDKLVIDNRYGSITVNTWDRNEFKVDVQIKVGARNASDAQSTLDNVKISDAKDGSNVAFRTDINSSDSWTSWGNGKRTGRHMEINYTVYMPAKNDLVIANRYGSIVLPDLSGNITINNAYGNFSAKSLSGSSTIRVSYGSATVGNLGTTAMDVSYGSLTIESVDNLAANVSYTSANIGKLRVSGSINLKYGGGLQIGDIGRDMKSLAINSSYSSVNVGLNGDENANFDVTVHFGDFNYGDHNVTITGKTPADGDRGVHLTKSYKGYVGKAGSDKTIAINTSYGSVKFD